MITADEARKLQRHSGVNRVYHNLRNRVWGNILATTFKGVRQVTVHKFERESYKLL